MKIPLPVVALCALVAWRASAAEIVIHADKRGPSVAPTLYGAFFEDINRAGEGGLYGEMVQNRSFEDYPTPLAWTAIDNPSAEVSITLDKTSPLNPHNPTSLKVQITKIGSGRAGVFNQGFKGIPAGKSWNTSAEWVKKFQDAQRGAVNGMVVRGGNKYILSLYARQQSLAGPISISLETQKGEILAQQLISNVGSQWNKYEMPLVPKESDTNARLVITAATPGTFWLDMVSLFPKDTYNYRINGLRRDLMEMILNIHPGLLRFPGGSFSEGHVLADAWRWKETVGDVAGRPGNWDIWGYRSNNGLGFHEYLQMAEDLGAEPLYVAHVGMAEKDFVPMDQLEPWIQDVLDAIDYANSSIAGSKWGALRAKNGHPLPFHLKYIEIGNENGMGYSWGGGKRADYLPRYKAFYDRIKAAHPEIVTIANIHTEPDVPADVVDEHYYPSSDWFFRAATKYDNYDRKKPKIYVGEYAVRKDAGHGNMRAALAEAAFLTGLERNADVVVMSSYAPLLTNPQWQRWTPDAIVFDSERAYGTPSYYVQSMFASNRPDVVTPISLPQQSGTTQTLFAVAGLKNGTGDLILKVVNSSDSAKSLDVHLAGVQTQFGECTCTELSAASLTDENSFALPKKIAPKVSKIAIQGAACSHSFPAYSVTVLRWSRGQAH